MEIIRIGLDLAKSVFEVCGVDMRDHVVLRKSLRREAVPQFFAELPPCLIGMEACSSSHYWAKVLTDLGHQVCLIAPQFVTPYVKSNKNGQTFYDIHVLVTDPPEDEENMRSLGALEQWHQKYQAQSHFTS